MVVAHVFLEIPVVVDGCYAVSEASRVTLLAFQGANAKAIAQQQLLVEGCLPVRLVKCPVIAKL